MFTIDVLAISMLIQSKHKAQLRLMAIPLVLQVFGLKPKFLQYVFWEPWMSDFMAIDPKDVEIFQSGQKRSEW